MKECETQVRGNQRHSVGKPARKYLETLLGKVNGDFLPQLLRRDPATRTCRPYSIKNVGRFGVDTAGIRLGETYKAVEQIKLARRVVVHADCVRKMVIARRNCTGETFRCRARHRAKFRYNPIYIEAIYRSHPFRKRANSSLAMKKKRIADAIPATGARVSFL